VVAILLCAFTSITIGSEQGELGMIEGSVVDLAGQAIAGAIVTVRGNLVSSTQNLMTSETGRFVAAVIPGTYRVSASKAGLLSEAAARQLVGEYWPEVTISKATARVQDLVIRLARGSVISGTVVDDTNEPVPNLTVQLLMSKTLGDREIFEPSSFGSSTLKTLTSDRGEYRFPMVIPGTYLVGVLAQRSDQGALAQSLYDIPWLYPGTRQLSGASPISVTSGEVRSGVDLRLEARTGYVVSGRVTGSPEPRRFVVRLTNADVDRRMSAIEVARVTSELTGAFTMPPVAPGRYTISVLEYPRAGNGEPLRLLSFVDSRGARVLGGARGDVESLPTYWVSLAIDVTRDVSDVLLSLRSGIRLCGHVDFSGSSPLPSPETQATTDIWFVPTDRSNAETPVTSLTAEGRFCSAGLAPGSYQINVMAGFPGWQLASVRQNGRDVTGMPLDLSTETTVIFTDRSTELRGTIRSRRGDVIPNAFIAVFPAAQTLWPDSGPLPLLLRHARADSAGEFKLTRMVEGKYFVVATSEPLRQDWTLQDNLRRLALVASPIQVELGKSTVVNLVARPSSGR